MRKEIFCRNLGLYVIPICVAPQAVRRNHNEAHAFARLGFKQERLPSLAQLLTVGLIDDKLRRRPLHLAEVDDLVGAVDDEVAQFLGMFFEGNRLYERLARGWGVLKEIALGNDVPPETIGFWLAEQGFMPETRLAVAVLKDMDAEQSENGVYPALRTVKQRLGHAIAHPHKGTIIVLLEASGAGERLEKAISGLSICGGLSRGFANPGRLAEHLGQARAAASAAPTTRSGIIGYESVFRSALRDVLTSKKGIACCVDDAVAELWGGNERERELVRCLYQWLVNGGNLSAASRALYVHRNTLIYRLHLLEEKIGAALDELSDDERLLYLVSCVCLMDET
jgi:hypothetical protein